MKRAVFEADEDVDDFGVSNGLKQLKTLFI